MDARTYAYEGMFILSQAVAADLAGALEHINELLARANAEVLAIKKWDERRLAFEVKGQKRGIYILTYFKAPGPRIHHLERDCTLSEKVLRFMILRADHLAEDEMRAADGRDQLMIEAKMRAEQAQREQESAARLVAMGAPASASAPAATSDAPSHAQAEPQAPAQGE